jgi:hypothetical protein
MAARVSPGQIEAAACELVIRFQKHFFGRGPTWVAATCWGNALVVQLRGVLTPAEQSLVEPSSPDSQRGQSLLRDCRDQLVRQAEPRLIAQVAELTGRPVEGIHLLHDLVPASNEEVFVFSFSGAGAMKCSCGLERVRDAAAMAGLRHCTATEGSELIG